MRGRRWKVRILAGALILMGLIEQATAQMPAGKPAAVVNGVAISMADFEAAKKRLPQPPVELTADRKKMMDMQLLSMMIDDVLIKQFLAANVPPVPAVEVERHFASLVENVQKQGKSMADYCKEAGTNEQEIRAELASRLQWANYGATRLTEADLQKYYLENKDFFDETMVRASHILIRLQPGTPENEKAQARARLTALRNDLLAKKIDFAEAAKKYSQCPSAAKGGDLDFFPRKGVVDEEFARVAFGLQIGQVSEIVQTVFGLHLIMPTQRKEGKGSDYNKIKDDVREMCLQELWQAVMASQRQHAKIEINLP
jgi:parvulin-like peptidyl-prolyl isomerase